MAARRGKSQAKRNSSGGLPGWAWLVIGVLVTLLAVILVPRFLKHDGGNDFLRIGPKPNPDALPAAVNEDNAAIAPDVAPVASSATAKPTQYDFYTLLPGEGVQMSDAELAASAKAEAEAHARAQKLAAATATGTPDGPALPAPVNETTAATGKPDAANPEPTRPDASRPQPAKPEMAKADTPVPAATDAHYILQAGAFGASGDAEAVKAKIAMLGLSARVESAQIGDKTVYRVRMGPYGSASELADAKARLSGGGLPAIAVKTH
ncbi:MAG: SPOR domain-containing protein [Xanthomonadaceae bacterium]|nr:SPOR domain-containing protein [Xanthomonadaceae bacterium]